jgi:hypothetical protein
VTMRNGKIPSVSDSDVEDMLHDSRCGPRTFLNFLRSNSWRATCNYLLCTTAPVILLGMGSTKQGWVSLLFHLHLQYFSTLSEHFLPKGLSQIFAPIPGGPHGTIYNAPLLVQYGLAWY